MGSRLPGGVMVWTVRFFGFHFYSNGTSAQRKVPVRMKNKKERKAALDCPGPRNMQDTHTESGEENKGDFPENLEKTRTIKRSYETYVVWGQGIHVIL